MPTAHSLVAPTQKMSDDEPYRQSGPQVAAPYPLPAHPSQPPLMPAPTGDIRSVTTRPGPGAAPRGQTSSAPPQNAYGHSVPPQNNSHPPHNNGVPPQNHSHPPHNDSVPPQNRGATPPAGHSMPPNPPLSTAPRASSRGVTPAAGTSLPPGGARRSQAAPADSVAAAPSGRRWGLIIFVLLIDIGLASSGAWMLSQGLAN